MDFRTTGSCNKSAPRHVKRISENSVQDKAKTEDLLSQLRKYRRNKSKNSVNDDFEKTENSVLRPGSAGFTGNIFSNIKQQNLIPFGSYGKKTRTVSDIMLEQSVDRLYRGSRTQVGKSDIHKTPLFKLANVVSQQKVEQIEESLKILDEQTNKSILEDLTFLSSFKFDLELNWDISRGKEVAPSESRLGIYYILEEKLRNPANVGPLNSFSLDPIITELKECSRLFRDILRGIISKGAEDEGILIEMLWKNLFKIIDKCISKHEYSINKIVECSKSALKYSTEHFKETLTKKNQELQLNKDCLEKQLNDCTEQIQALTKEKNQMAKSLNEKSQAILELTEVESQEKACVELRQMLSKLSSYITESETEKSTQLKTLHNLSYMIGAADILKEKPQTSHKSSQTSIQISESHLAELGCFQVSKYQLFGVLEKNLKTSPKYNALTLCASAFEECDGQRQYYIELTMFLISMYKEKDTLFSNIRSIYHQLQTDPSIQAKFYLMLLNNCKKSLLKVEQNMFKLADLFEKNSENGTMVFSKFLDFLQSFLPDEKTFCEELLEKMTQNFEEKDRVSIIEHRFLLCYEKLPKNIKLFLENDSVQSHEFLDWCKYKLVVWASDNEIDVFFKSRSHQRPSQWFNIDLPDKIKELRVEKENFLLSFLVVSFAKFSQSEAAGQKIESITDYLIFKDAMLKENHQLTERQISNCFAEIILGTAFEEVQEKILNYDFAGLKIIDSPRSKRKSPAKSPVKKNVNK